MGRTRAGIAGPHTHTHMDQTKVPLLKTGGLSAAVCDKTHSSVRLPERNIWAPKIESGCGSPLPANQRISPLILRLTCGCVLGQDT